MAAPNNNLQLNNGSAITSVPLLQTPQAPPLPALPLTTLSANAALMRSYMMSTVNSTTHGAMNRLHGASHQHRRLAQPLLPQMLRQAQIHQQAIDEGCEWVRNMVSISISDPDTIDAVFDGIAAIQSNVSGLCSCLPGFADATSPTQPTVSSACAQKAFHISELLEAILSFLNPKDLLVAQQVCRNFRNTIEESAKLQRRLGLNAAEPTSFLHVPPKGMPGTTKTNRYQHPTPALTFYVRGPYHMASFNSRYFLGANFNNHPGGGSNDSAEPVLNNEAMISIHVNPGEGEKLPVVGSRVASMLVCQPPLAEMTITINCCSQSLNRNIPILVAGVPAPILPPVNDLKLTNPIGITVGDVLHSARELVKTHRRCPHASEYVLDKHGYVRLQLTYDATVTLQPGDPIVKEARKLQLQVLRTGAREDQRLARFADYCAAKRNAHEEGLPIPNLAQFEASEMAKAFEHRAQSFRTGRYRLDGEEDTSEEHGMDAPEDMWFS